MRRVCNRRRKAKAQGPSACSHNEEDLCSLTGLGMTFMKEDRKDGMMAFKKFAWAL